MNKKNLDRIIEQYINNFTVLNASEEEGGNDEGYKWRVISSFKKHWDMNAEDFSDMFQKSMYEIAKTNLINNSMIQPISGIANLMKVDNEAEFVRNEFRKLFSEDGGNLEDRGDRVNAFMDNMNERISEKLQGSWKSVQPRNAVIFYLNLWRPDDNYLFKATEAKEWADTIEFADDFGSGSSFSLKKYYKMCDELRVALNNYPEVLELNKTRVVKEAVGYDDHEHLLAFDIIYCSHYMDFYKDCPSLGVSTKERIRIARRREETERIENDILSNKKAIDEIEAQIKPYPDITGEKVIHKTFGEGQVINCNNGYFTVRFPSRESIFTGKALIQCFLKMENCSNEIYQNNFKLGIQIKDLNDKIKSLYRKLEALE